MYFKCILILSNLIVFLQLIYKKTKNIGDGWNPVPISSSSLILKRFNDFVRYIYRETLGAA